MKIIVGLGNPGAKYRDTRHNIGFRALDHLVESLKSHERFSYNGKEMHALYEAEEFFYTDATSGAKEKFLFVKPLTFMNNSGKALKEIIRYAGGKFELSKDMWVFHDDIDIEFGKVKPDFNRSSAGHNGVQDIIEQLGSKEFVRFRFGILPQGGFHGETQDFVLGKFSDEEKKQLPSILKMGDDAFFLTLEHGYEFARNVLATQNKKTP